MEQTPNGPADGPDTGSDPILSEDEQNAEWVELLRARFHETVGALLVPDPSYRGIGVVYTVKALEADLDEVMSEAARAVAQDDQDYADWEHDFDMFTQLADGTDRSLITCSTADSWGYGIDTAQVLDRGYLYLPGMSIDGIPWVLIGAWEPVSARAAFEHAFTTQYLAYAEGGWSTLPLWTSEGVGFDSASGDVAPEPLAEAIERYLARNPGAWWDVWQIINESRREPLPPVSWMEENTSMSSQSARILIEALANEAEDFEEAVLSLPEPERRGVIYVYLHAEGLMPNDPLRK